jgi:hypothetical protein
MWRSTRVANDGGDDPAELYPGSDTDNGISLAMLPSPVRPWPGWDCAGRDLMKGWQFWWSNAENRRSAQNPISVSENERGKVRRLGGLLVHQSSQPRARRRSREADVE